MNSHPLDCVASIDWTMVVLPNVEEGRLILTDQRVGQTQAITIARTDSPSTSRLAPGQAALQHIKHLPTIICSFDGSSSLKGTRVLFPASRPQFHLLKGRK